MKRYYGDGAFWDENITGNYYEITVEYEQSLHDYINNAPREELNEIVPDKNGKPVVRPVEIDYAALYRKRRERECFPIINRGAPWYEALNADQRQELQIWYQEWLDVTETLAPPHKPTWLK